MLLRPLVFLAFAGLLALPDWSTARPFRRFLAGPPVACPVVYSYAAAPPVVYAPVTYPSPPVSAGACVSGPVFAEPVVLGPVIGCPPAAPATKGPTVVPERMPEGKQSVGPTVEPRAEPKATGPSPVRPVSAEERASPPPAATPTPMPIPIPSVPPRPLGEPLPRGSAVEFAPPKAADPQTPTAKPLTLPEFPPLGLEKPGELPKSTDPTKIAPAATEPAKPAPQLPPLLDNKPTEPKGDALPTFELPALPPLAPANPVASEKPTVSKSSPLNADPVADIYPVAGTPAAPAAKRSVGFINKSGRDIVLTVDGKTTRLPDGQYLRLDLPAKFTWQLGGEKERETTVPDTAPGVSVVIRK